MPVASMSVSASKALRMCLPVRVIDGLSARRDPAEQLRLLSIV
jgi:hypothetical protein